MSQRRASEPTLGQCLGIAALIIGVYFALLIAAAWLPILLPMVLP